MLNLSLHCELMSSSLDIFSSLKSAEVVLVMAVINIANFVHVVNEYTFSMFILHSKCLFVKRKEKIPLKKICLGMHVLACGPIVIYLCLPEQCA